MAIKSVSMDINRARKTVEVREGEFVLVISDGSSECVLRCPNPAEAEQAVWMFGVGFQYRAAEIKEKYRDAVHKGGIKAAP